MSSVIRKRSRTEEGEEISVETARNSTKGKDWESEEVVLFKEASEMSARTMRVHPSCANAVAAAFPMPECCCIGKMEVIYGGVRKLTGGSTSD